MALYTNDIIWLFETHSAEHFKYFDFLFIVVEFFIEYLLDWLGADEFAFLICRIFVTQWTVPITKRRNGNQLHQKSMMKLVKKRKKTMIQKTVAAPAVRQMNSRRIKTVLVPVPVACAALIWIYRSSI